MRIWRLSHARHAHAFDGGFGLVSPGRWNSLGQRVTYCSTVPSLCALEKRVHYRQPDLIPPQQMIEYRVPDDLPMNAIDLNTLPVNWHRREAYTRRLGERWFRARSEAILFVPSVLMPIATAVDRNVLVNHDHPDVSRIEIVNLTPFELDPRLFAA